MKVVRTDNAPAAIGPYSQGIVVNGMLFASGQIALDPASGEMVGTTIQEQTEQVMKKESHGRDKSNSTRTFGRKARYLPNTAGEFGRPATACVHGARDV